MAATHDRIAAVISRIGTLLNTKLGDDGEQRKKISDLMNSGEDRILREILELEQCLKHITGGSGDGDSIETYYVDCQNGDDTYDGRDMEHPRRTLSLLETWAHRSSCTIHLKGYTTDFDAANAYDLPIMSPGATLASSFRAIGFVVIANWSDSDQNVATLRVPVETGLNIVGYLAFRHIRLDIHTAGLGNAFLPTYSKAAIYLYDFKHNDGSLVGAATLYQNTPVYINASHITIPNKCSLFSTSLREAFYFGSNGLNELQGSGAIGFDILPDEDAIVMNGLKFVPTIFFNGVSLTDFHNKILSISGGQTLILKGQLWQTAAGTNDFLTVTDDNGTRKCVDASNAIGLTSGESFIISIERHSNYYSIKTEFFKLSEVPSTPLPSQNIALVAVNSPPTFASGTGTLTIFPSYNLMMTIK